jgi:hypothetical protein
MLIGLRWTHKTRIVEQNAFNGKYVEGVYCFGIYELCISILKVVAEGLTAAFGILGLLTSFRNEVTKKITGVGRLALVGILCSFAVSSIIAATEIRVLEGP